MLSGETWRCHHGRYRGSRWGELLELRDWEIKMVRQQEKNEERKVLMAVAIMGELISDQCQVNLRKIKTRTQLLKSQF